MTSNIPSGTGRPYASAIELTPDVWIMIMGYLSTSDLVIVGKTCTTLRCYSQLRHVWVSALRKHRFLSASYPHLLNATTEAIRRQLIITACLDAAYNQSSLVAVRTHSFSLDFQGTFQGLRWLPGGDWLVLLFHSRTLNPERHSNLWLFKPDVAEAESASVPPAISATLQSKWCWLPITEQDGPYLTSRGDNLLLLHTYTPSVRTFGICLLDTTKPSVDVKMTVQTSVFIRNYVAAGDYFVYGWTVIDGSERKHLVRIMKLNENYSRFSQDVTVEIDCPPGHSGKLRIKYDLRLTGNTPRLLLVSARLMAAYNIPNSSLSTPGSTPRLLPVWKYVPEGHLSFGRILRVFAEGAIVTLRDGKTRYTVPDIHSNNRQMNSQTTTVYSFLRNWHEDLLWPAVFDSQRAFWPVRISSSSLKSSGESLCRTNSSSSSAVARAMIETALVPSLCDGLGGEYAVRRLPIDYESTTEEHVHFSSSRHYQTDTRATRKSIVQDWDELSGKLCVRHMKARSGLAQTSMRIVVMHMV